MLENFIGIERNILEVAIVLFHIIQRKMEIVSSPETPSEKRKFVLLKTAPRANGITNIKGFQASPLPNASARVKTAGRVEKHQTVMDFREFDR